MKLFLFITAFFLTFEAIAQNFPQAPLMPPSNFNQFSMNNTFMYGNYQRSDEKLLEIEEERVLKLKLKIEKKKFELDSLKIKKTQISKNISVDNEKEIEKTSRKITNIEEKIEDLNYKVDLSNSLISDLKLNIELIKRKKEEKARVKAEKKDIRAKKSKKIDNSDYEDTD